MKCANYTILMKEIPGKISLCFAMTGCQMKCKDCHSPELWDKNNGFELNLDIILPILEKYKGLFDVVLFFGGEWNGLSFANLLKELKGRGYQTALFTGLSQQPAFLTKYLDYVKTGAYIPELGGLETVSTNQRLVNLNTGDDLTYKFWSNSVVTKETIELEKSQLEVLETLEGPTSSFEPILESELNIERNLEFMGL